MNNEEDLKLIKSIQQFNNQDDLNQLFLRYEYIVDFHSKTIAKSNHFDYDDFYQEGALALFDAARKYDANSNASFKTFASACVKNRIIDEIKKLHPKNQPLPLEDNIISTVDDPLNYLYTKEIINYINTHFSDTESKIIKYKLSGFPYAAISKMLNISTKKIDNTLYKCRKIVHLYIDTIEK